MTENWIPIDEDDRDTFFNMFSSDKLYRIRFEDGSEIVAIIEDKCLVRNTYDRKPINTTKAVAYSIVGE